MRWCLAGRRHGLSAADLTALGAALRTSRIPCSTPSVAQGAPDGSYGAGPSRGCDRRYRPGLRLSRVFHLHQACMDHPLEVARQRLEVDGKPHPTAPSHPQAPKPVGALQLGVCPLYPGPYGIPLAPLLGGLGPRRVGRRRVTQVARSTFPSAPLRTGRATFTASGSPVSCNSQ